MLQEAWRNIPELQQSSNDLPVLCWTSLNAFRPVPADGPWRKSVSIFCLSFGTIGRQCTDVRMIKRMQCGMSTLLHVFHELCKSLELCVGGGACFFSWASFAHRLVHFKYTISNVLTDCLQHPMFVSHIPAPFFWGGGTAVLLPGCCYR